MDNTEIQYQCPVEVTLSLIGGKWKVLILFYLLENKVLRYGELKGHIPGISKKMLSQQLTQLEAAGLINRKAYAEVPPRVEYSLSDYGKTLKEILSQLCTWGAVHARKHNIPIGTRKNKDSDREIE